MILFVKQYRGGGVDMRMRLCYNVNVKPINIIIETIMHAQFYGRAGEKNADFCAPYIRRFPGGGGI